MKVCPLLYIACAVMPTNPGVVGEQQRSSCRNGTAAVHALSTGLQRPLGRKCPRPLSCSKMARSYISPQNPQDRPQFSIQHEMQNFNLVAFVLLKLYQKGKLTCSEYNEKNVHFYHIKSVHSQSKMKN